MRKIQKLEETDRHILYLDRKTVGLKMTVLFNLCVYLEPNKK